MTEDEKLLVRRAQGGDAEAFQALYERHLRRIYNISWRMMGNAADAQDMAQESMLKAWRALPRFKLDSAFGTWLYRIAVNACSDELRRRRAKFVSMEQLAEVGHEPGCEGFEERTVTGDSIQQAILQLQEEYRAAVVLRDVEGYAYEDIASILQCPMGTVRSRISRGREQLRALLTQDGTLPREATSNQAERGRT